MAISNSSFVVDVPAHGFPVKTSRDRLAIVETCIKQGDLTGAEQACMAILGTAPSSAEAWFFLGLIRQRQDTFDEAAEHYEHALSLAPRFPEARNNLGVVLQELDKIEAAEACFRQALALDPGYAEAHNNLGNALQDLGRLTEAETAYRRALDLRPNYVDALHHLGNAPALRGAEPKRWSATNKCSCSSPIMPRCDSAGPWRGSRWAIMSADGPSMSGGYAARRNRFHLWICRPGPASRSMGGRFS